VNESSNQDADARLNSILASTNVRMIDAISRYTDLEEGINRVIGALAAEAEQDRHEDEDAAGAGIGADGPSGEIAGEASAPDHPQPARDVAVNEAQAAPRLLTVGETARRMNVSKKTINKLIQSGELEAIGEGRSLRVPEHTIQAYQEHNLGRPEKNKTKAIAAAAGRLLAAGAVAGAVAGITYVYATRRLTEPDEIANAARAPVLASIPALHPASPAEWRTLLDSYRHAPAQARQLHKALQELGVIDRPAGGGSIAMLTLLADPGALALGPQLAVYAASLGIKTALVIGPGPDTQVTAALRAACAMAPVNQLGNLRTVSHKATEDAKREYAADELTILVTVVDGDAGPVLETMRATTSIVIGVSAGAATADQLGRVAAIGGGRAVAGVLIAKPVTTGRGTGPIPHPAGAPEHRQPMSDHRSAEAMLCGC